MMLDNEIIIIIKRDPRQIEGLPSDVNPPTHPPTHTHTRTHTHNTHTQTHTHTHTLTHTRQEHPGLTTTP